MLSANTVWLEPNTTKAPMNNVNFRKALAYGLNPSAIAQTVYGGIALPANPTGLLPTLNGYIDQSVVSKYGFSYNTTLAKQYLAKSGYHGQAVTLQVPDGWTDWMQGIQVIQQELSAIGINIQLVYPQYPARTQNLTNGNYDLALDNNAGLDSTPWSYFQRVYAAADPGAPDRPAELGAVQLAGRLEPGAEGGRHSAHRHRHAEVHLQPAGERLPPAAAADPGLVQRCLVPGQHQVLAELPVQRHAPTRTCRSCGAATSAR